VDLYVYIARRKGYQTLCVSVCSMLQIRNPVDMSTACIWRIHSTLLEELNFALCRAFIKITLYEVQTEIISIFKTTSLKISVHLHNAHSIIYISIWRIFYKIPSISLDCEHLSHNISSVLKSEMNYNSKFMQCLFML
jgi:hypothetical protein